MIIKASKEKINANTLRAEAAFFIKSSLLHRCTIAAAPPNPNPEVGGAVAEFAWFSTSATGGAVGSVGVDSTCWWFDLGSSKFDMFLEVYALGSQQRTLTERKLLKERKLFIYLFI